jgi:cold shock CspA family protein
MATGQVKLFNQKDGYGVIQADERNDVVFFRAQSCDMSLRVGDRVQYSVRLNPKSGQREAVEIKPQAA